MQDGEKDGDDGEKPSPAVCQDKKNRRGKTTKGRR
jgi:hypothetical protein